MLDSIKGSLGIDGEVSDTVFGGDGDESKFGRFDAFVDGFNEKKRLIQSKADGLVEKINGFDMFKTGAGGECKIPLTMSDKVNFEKLGASKFMSRLDKKVKLATGSCGWRQARDILKGAAIIAKGSTLSDERWKAAALGLSTALPFQLSKACQNLIDNFAKDVKSRYNGYDKITPGGSKFVESDMVQCAMDAMEMLSGIKGLKGKIMNTLIDIEASAVVLAGMITTLVDYEMIEDIEAVIGTSPSTRAAKRAIGLSEAVLTSTGNLTVINWMLDELGVPEALGYNPDLTTSIAGNYRRINDGDDQYFFDTLSRVDPGWDRDGELFYFTVIASGSPDAIAAFENNDAYRSLSMVSDTEFIESKSAVRLPTIGEVTRELYPRATGPGLSPDINTTNPMYFYV